MNLVIWESLKDADISLKFDEQRDVKDYELENVNVEEYYEYYDGWMPVWWLLPQLVNWGAW